MHITAEPRDHYTVLHLRGEFDTYYGPLLQQEIEQLIAAGSTQVVLNLRLVKFINSTALGAIIKASKMLKAKGGALAVSRPSSFVREVFDKMRMDRVVPCFDSDEAAGDSFNGGEAPAPQSAEAEPELDETSVLFSLTDSERLEHFVDTTGRANNPVHGHAFGKNWRGIGRMADLSAEGLSFTWNGGKTGLNPFEMGQLLALGTELKIKFRLPLLKRGHCEATANVTAMEERPDGVKVALAFDSLDDTTADQVRQYAEDLAYLKKELREATDQ